MVTLSGATPLPSDLIKYGFVAGELSPTFFGRTDLTKYDMAMAEAYNFFVDYRGGLSSRAGFEFVDYIPDYVQGARTLELIEPPLFFNFVYDDVDFSFVGLISPINATGTTDFDHSIIRFLQNGKYVVEAQKAVSAITLADPAVITCTAHGYTTGDWVRFSADRPMNYEWRNRTVEVEVLTANTFSARSITDGELIDSTAFNTYIGGYGVSRILTLECTYAPEEYKVMALKQYRDLIRITHPAHPIRNLIRSNDPLDGVSDENGNVWHIEDEVIGSDVIGPTIQSHTSSAIPTDGAEAEVIFAVSSVYADGSESIRGPMYHISGIVNYPATEGSVSVVWDPDPLASYYNVYRSIVSVTEVLSSGTELGFVGQAKGTKFTDPNIIPDFTRTPPQRRDPFAVQPIAEVNVTAGGTGYVDFATTASASGGMGFAGEAVVDDTGAVVNVVVRDAGHDYVVGEAQAGILSFTGAGAGATATVTVNETLGTYPAQSCVFQQRQIYAGSYDHPTTIWGSQVKQFSSFDVTPNLIDSDSFEFVLDTPSFAPIRHMIPTQGGLLVTTQENIWVLNGGGPSEPLTPTSAVAIPQTQDGTSIVPPIKIGPDLLYVEGRGNSVRMLSYNEIQRVYAGDDRSILSNHLFGLGKSISSWAYQEEPFKLVWGARSDGELLAFTVVKAEDIYAWTPCGTRGQFLSVTNIRENNSFNPDIQVVNDRVYVVTQRYLQGRWRRMVERMALRNFVNVEDAFCVDCAWDMPANYCQGNLNIWLEDKVWYAKTDTGDLLDIDALIQQFSEVVELNL
jgi:hypothetical protein